MHPLNFLLIFYSWQEKRVLMENLPITMKKRTEIND